jgi:hypothetical protein
MQNSLSILPGKIEIGDRVEDGEDWNWNDRGYLFVAKLVRDDDQPDDNFGPGHCFDLKDPDHHAQNLKIHDALLRGDWCYFGVRVKAYRCGLELGENSLWGIEGNFTYEGREGPVDNTYFNEVMEECASEAALEAKHKIHELMASLLNVEYKPVEGET